MEETQTQGAQVVEQCKTEDTNGYSPAEEQNQSSTTSVATAKPVNNKHGEQRSVVYDKHVPAELKKKIAQTKKLKNGDKDCAKEEKKLVDILIHVFDGLDTTEEKMEALARKYVLLATDHRMTEIKLDEVTTRYTMAVKGKDFLQLENTKMSSAKYKLECLCRELQKQNKAIKNDANRRASEEDQKRKELSEKFQVTINEISTQVTENHQANQQLRIDNNELAQKLKGLLDQYEIREQHIEKVMKAKELELQLCETKLQQQILQGRQQKEQDLQEKQLILQDSLEQKKRCELLMKQEIELKGQLEIYTGKFQEFQSTLTKSNSVFATFQKEMGKMTKANKKLEKESTSWRTRYESTNRSVIQMLDERKTKEQELFAIRNKVDKLENLCRVLQSERNDLRKQITALKPSIETSNVAETAEQTSNVDDGTALDSRPTPDDVHVDDSSDPGPDTAVDGEQTKEADNQPKKNQEADLHVQ